MRVDGAPQDGREVKELEAHGQHDPGDGVAGPGGPAAARVVVLVPGIPGPQDVLDEAAGDIGGHVVRVVPAP